MASGSGRNLTALIIGSTGAGKSSIGNTLSGKNSFLSGNSANSITSVHQVETFQLNGLNVKLVDSVGANDTEMNSKEVRGKITEALAAAGPTDVIFLVIPAGRFGDEQANTYQFLIEATLGQKACKNMYLILTRSGGNLMLQEAEQLKWITDAKNNPKAAKVLADLDYKYVFVENPPVDIDPEAEAISAKRRASCRDRLMQLLQSHTGEQYQVSYAWETQAKYDAAQNKAKADALAAQAAADAARLAAAAEEQRARLQREHEARVKAEADRRHAEAMRHHHQRRHSGGCAIQ